ncbi:MAG: hypothetical protein JXB49_07820 [Bacteroidales bacterium]|nr:hypothetical protein [Bacteroidales bacterium]
MSNLQKFNTTLEDFDKEVGKLKAVSTAYQKLEALVDSYGDISNQFEQSVKMLENINELHKGHLEKVENILEENTELIRRENKDFYKEFESTIRIKLDDNKSQIKQLIENERIRIKEIFEIEFAKNTKELIQVIINETNKQSQILLSYQKSIKISIWLLGGVNLFLCAMAIYKLWF